MEIGVVVLGSIILDSLYSKRIIVLLKSWCNV